MKVLTIPIKKHWFELIAEGKKPFDYRRIQKYWIDRLFHLPEMEWGVWDEFVCDLKKPVRHTCVTELLEFFGVKTKEYDEVHLTNGYGFRVPRIKSKYNGFTFSNVEFAKPTNNEPFKDRCFAIPVFEIKEIWRP